MAKTHNPPWSCHLHLQVSHEPLHGHFLFDLQEEAVAAPHHALQDVQRHLLYGGIRELGVDKVGNLWDGGGGLGGGNSRVLKSKNAESWFRIGGGEAAGGGRRASTFLMKMDERFSQETIPWSMSCMKAVSVWVMIRLLLQEGHPGTKRGKKTKTKHLMLFHIFSCNHCSCGATC